MKNKGLGKGLAALISQQNGDLGAKEQETGPQMVNIKNIEPNKFQPRKMFDEDTIAELASSIAQHGIIQPIITRKIPESNKYQIIAGERRWRAALLVGLDEVPIISRDIDDKELAEQALIENIQRQNLNPVEEANAYHELMQKYQYSQEQLSKSLGKSRSHVANMLRVTTLPDSVKKYLEEGKISFGHAKVIAGHEKAELIAKEIISGELSVRKTEDLIKDFSQKSNNTPRAKSKEIENVGDLKAIEDSLTDILGLRVKIENQGSSGRVIISFNNYVQLDDIIETLSK
ncbi:MAG: ParB/RepB/Spo0J family partition protein [Rickettsiaceae bacterium]|nr:ParB/RepB/Spo0J family partition protein [Rickettsiaceae bacterium]